MISSRDLGRGVGFRNNTHNPGPSDSLSAELITYIRTIYRTVEVLPQNFMPSLFLGTSGQF